MIRTAGRGPDLSETNEKRVIHEGPRRTTKGHEGVEVNRDGIPRSRKDCRFLIVLLSYDPPRRGGRGPDLSETKEKRQKKKELSTKGHEERRRATKALRLTATGYQGHERIVDFRLFHSRMIRPVVGGGGRTCLKQKKKELSTKGHEERRRATKALRLTATGYQGHERIVDFRLSHSRMIRPVGRGPDLSETNEKRVIHEGPRRTTKGHEGVEVNRDGIPRSRKDCRFPIVSLSNDPPGRAGARLV